MAPRASCTKAGVFRTTNVRVTGTNIALTIAGQTLTGNFSFERTTVNGAPLIQLTVSNATLSLADRVTTVGKLASGVAHELGEQVDVNLGYRGALSRRNIDHSASAALTFRF